MRSILELIFYCILGGIIGGIVALVLLDLGRRRLHKKIETLQFEEDVEAMLDGVMGAFRGQVPMAGMFLKGALEEKLKNVGRKEVIKVLPDIKKKIQRRMIGGYGKVLLKGCLLGVGLGVLIGILGGWVVRF